MPRLLRAALLAFVISPVLALFGVAPAGAAVSLSGIVSPTAVSWTPNVFAGTTNSTTCLQWFGGACANSGILATAIVNGEVVVAGAFTQVCQPGPASSGHCAAGTLVTRDDIFAYQLGTGTIDPNFAPQLDQGPVYSLAAGPNDTVYVGGAFTTVNGASHRGLVQLQVTPGTASTDGLVVAAFTGQVSSTVRALAFNGSALYVGGEFISVDSTSEDGIARLNATTGALDTTFGMSISNPVVSGLSLKVEDLSLTPDGNTLAIAGTFLDVNGQSRPRVALIATGGGLGAAATLENWAAPILANNCSAEHDYVRGIDFSPDGSYFVIADTGANSSPGNSASVCDAAARFPAGQVGTSVQPTWVNYTGRDSFYSVQVTGGVVYLGGHNRWSNNECGGDSRCEADSVLDMGFTAIDANTGLTIPWFNSYTLRGRGVMSLTAFGAGLFTGSNGGLLLGDNVTLNGNGAYHSFAALLPLRSTTGVPTFGSITSGIFAQGRLGGHDESSAGVAAMCVDDPGNSAASGTTVKFSTCANKAEQNWTVQANGTITINPGGTVTATGLCLDNPSGSTVVLNACNSAATQVWAQGAGNILTNSASGLCLTDPSSSTTNGTALDATTCPAGTPPANQVWPLPAAPAPSFSVPVGSMSTQAVQSSSQPACLNDPGNSKTANTAVTMYTCEGIASETVTMQANSNVTVNGLCLDTSGTTVVLNTCGSSTSQVWTQASPGSTLVNEASGLCLNATGTVNGAGLTVATCSPSSSSQRWWLPAL